jgi:hypothetical protein
MVLILRKYADMSLHVVYILHVRIFNYLTNVITSNKFLNILLYKGLCDYIN